MARDPACTAGTVGSPPVRPSHASRETPRSCGSAAARRMTDGSTRLWSSPNSKRCRRHSGLARSRPPIACRRATRPCVRVSPWRALPAVPYRECATPGPLPHSGSCGRIRDPEWDPGSGVRDPRLGLGIRTPGLFYCIPIRDVKLSYGFAMGAMWIWETRLTSGRARCR